MAALASVLAAAAGAGALYHQHSLDSLRATQQRQAQELAAVQAELASLRNPGGRAGEGQADAAAQIRADLDALLEAVITVRDRLGVRLDRLEAGTGQAGYQQAFGTAAEGLVAEGLVAEAAAGTPDDAEAAAFRQSVMLAFRTLDGRFQAVKERLDALAARDRELAQGQEATLVAVQTGLNDWRERHSPPVWDLAAQLSGFTIRFLEGIELADPAKAETALSEVAAVLLAADQELGVRVVGYADFDGADPDSNRITSQKRADAVVAQLIQLGVPENRLVAVGRAAEERLIDSDAPGNANRRAVFEPFLLENTAPLAD
jgi:outer membrane protein OmpA-like peptidoglycan-associated protein